MGDLEAIKVKLSLQVMCLVDTELHASTAQPQNFIAT